MILESCPCGGEKMIEIIISFIIIRIIIISNIIIFIIIIGNDVTISNVIVV